METALSVAAFLLSLVSAGFSLYTFIWTACRDRKQATLDAFNQLQAQALDALSRYKTEQVEEIAKNPFSQSYKEIGGYIARIEHFSVGVNQQIYDKTVVYELAHGFLDKAIRKRIEPIIATKNRSGHDYYANIHRLYRWMDAEEAKREKRQTTEVQQHG